MRSDEEELEDLEPHTSKFRAQGQLMSYEEDPNFEGYLQVKVRVCVCVCGGGGGGGGVEGWLLHKEEKKRRARGLDRKVKSVNERERRERERGKRASQWSK